MLATQTEDEFIRQVSENEDEKIIEGLKKDIKTLIENSGLSDSYVKQTNSFLERLISVLGGKEETNEGEYLCDLCLKKMTYMYL